MINYCSKDGFSLIELSIVLIIIGLLIAGVTGGVSLIKSARLRAIINEYDSYRQATYAFIASKNRLPGDLAETGIIGQFGTGQTYTSNSFPAPYNSNSNGYGIPNILSAPIVDLYLEGLIDFEPKNTNYSTKPAQLFGKGGIPTSKYLSGYGYFFEYEPGGEVSTHCKYGITNKVSLILRSFDKKFDNSIAKNIDIKLDDGIFNTGKIRGACSDDCTSNYENPKFNGNKYCWHLYYFFQ